MKITAAIILAAALGVNAMSAFADEAKTMTVASIYKEKATLSGKEVRAQGKVVKVNNGIMGRNFVHIQDGTGDQTSNNLIVTSKQTASVGDQVVISGRVVLNRDFGAGYSYPLLLEDTSISPKK